MPKQAEKKINDASCLERIDASTLSERDATRAECEEVFAWLCIMFVYCVCVCVCVYVLVICSFFHAVANEQIIRCSRTLRCTVHQLVCRRVSNWLCCCAGVWLFVAETAGAVFAVGRPSEDDAVPVKVSAFV